MSVHLPLFRSSFFTVHPLLMLWAGSSCRWDSTHVLHPLLEAARHPEGWVTCFPAFERLTRALKEHLERFRNKLLAGNDAVLRRNFERRFDQDFGK